MRREYLHYEMALDAYQDSVAEMHRQEKKLYEAYKVKECRKHEFEKMIDHVFPKRVQPYQCKLCGYIDVRRK